MHAVLLKFTCFRTFYALRHKLESDDPCTWPAHPTHWGARQTTRAGRGGRCCWARACGPSRQAPPAGPAGQPCVGVGKGRHTAWAGPCSLAGSSRCCPSACGGAQVAIRGCCLRCCLWFLAGGRRGG